MPPFKRYVPRSFGSGKLYCRLLPILALIQRMDQATDPQRICSELIFASASVIAYHVRMYEIAKAIFDPRGIIIASIWPHF
jgi:hypothetical protein